MTKHNRSSVNVPWSVFKCVKRHFIWTEHVVLNWVTENICSKTWQIHFSRQHVRNK